MPNSSAVLLVSIPNSLPSSKARARGSCASAHGATATPLCAMAAWNKPCHENNFVKLTKRFSNRKCSKNIKSFLEYFFLYSSLLFYVCGVDKQKSACNTYEIWHTSWNLNNLTDTYEYWAIPTILHIHTNWFHKLVLFMKRTSDKKYEVVYVDSIN